MGCVSSLNVDCDDSNKKWHKILMFGAQKCGKSTLFKQLKIIYSSGFEEKEYIEAKYFIRYNCISSILKLLRYCWILYESDTEKHSDLYIDLNTNPLINEHYDNILKYYNNIDFQDTNDKNINFEMLYESLNYLWNLPQIGDTFNKHGEYFSFITNIDYYFNRLHIIFNSKYYPSIDDVLRCRIRTTNIFEEKYIINDRQFSIYDIGGSRAQRRKWIQLFEGVSVMIYIASLTSCNEKSSENELENAMCESIGLWKQLIHYRMFWKFTKIYLIFNKDDLFKQLLQRKGIKIGESLKDTVFETIYHDAYNNKNTFYSKYTLLTHGYIHQYVENIANDIMKLIDLYSNIYFDVFYDETIEYIKYQYLQCTNDLNKEIKVYFVSSINKQHIQQTMNDIINDISEI